MSSTVCTRTNATVAAPRILAEAGGDLLIESLQDTSSYQSQQKSAGVSVSVLPIADTGYLFIFEFGANIESQNNPAAHAKMQATFRHLIESVKIEPLQ